MKTKLQILEGIDSAINRDHSLDEAGSKDVENVFSSLKKGDKLEVVYDSSFSKGNKVDLIVKSRSESKKFNLKKVTMVGANNPNGVKYFFFHRLKSNNYSLAVGNSATVTQSVKKVSSFSKNENLDEANKKRKAVDKRETSNWINSLNAAIRPIQDALRTSDDDNQKAALKKLISRIDSAKTLLIKTEQSLMG